MDGYSSSALFSRPFRKYLPGLIGTGIGSVLGAWQAGSAARKQVLRDSSTKFQTWSERPSRMRMVSKPRRSFRRSYRRSAPRRPPAKSRTGSVIPMIRSTTVITASLAAAAFSNTARTVTLNQIYTTDLLSAYKLYRIRKVVLHLVPRYDTANSSLATNVQAFVAAACDPEDVTAPADTTAVTAYENSYGKWLPSGDHFTYTFYPKVVNAVGSGGATAYQGSYAANPWLMLNATGVGIPHNCLKLSINTGTGTTASFDFYYDIHFDVKGHSS